MRDLIKEVKELEECGTMMAIIFIVYWKYERWKFERRTGMKITTSTTSTNEDSPITKQFN